MFSLWNVQKKGLKWFNPSGMFLCLIRWTTQSPPWLNIRLKPSRHLIPYQTPCQCFSVMLTRWLTCPLRGQYTAKIAISSGTLYITLAEEKGQEHFRTPCVLHYARALCCMCHYSSNQQVMKTLHHPESMCLRQILCAFHYICLYVNWT